MSDQKRLYVFLVQTTISSVIFLVGATLLRSGTAQRNQQYTYAGGALLAVGSIITLDSMRKAKAYNRGE